MATHVLILLTVGVISQIQSASSACPDQCTCDAVNQKVDCSNAGLTRIPIDLPDPVGLKVLDLSGNHITELIQEIVMYTNLNLLDLSDNEMLNIDDNVLDSLPNLQFLYLQKNRLSTLTPRTLKGLDKLITLDLSQNLLEVVPDNAFSDLGKLINLYLNSNEVREIQDDAFSGLSHLTLLSLSDNKLTSVPTRPMQKLQTLTTLFMNFNEIENIPAHAFKDLKELRRLDLEANGIVHISEFAFHERETSDVPGLQILMLKSNKLENVPTEALQHMKELHNLDLSGNLIEILSADVLKGLDHIRFIAFNAMPELTIVEKYAFAELPDLRIVNLHSNRKLTTIDEGAFLGSSSLSMVDLHANNLESLSANVFDWEHLDRLDLRYNPWRCDCHLKWMKSVLSNIRSNLSSSLAQHVSCSQPESKASLKVLELEESDFICETPPDHQFQDHIMIAIFASFSVLLIIVMAYLLIRNKYIDTCNTGQRQINYHVHKNGIVRIRRMNDEDRNDPALVENEEQPDVENQA